MHSDHCQTSKIVLFRKIIDGFKSLFNTFCMAGLFEDDSEQDGSLKYYQVEESRLRQGQS